MPPVGAPQRLGSFAASTVDVTAVVAVGGVGDVAAPGFLERAEFGGGGYDRRPGSLCGRLVSTLFHVDGPIVGCLRGCWAAASGALTVRGLLRFTAPYCGRAVYCGYLASPT